MSEKEKQFADSILGTLNKLTDAKGSEFTEGLIAGINIGTVSSAASGGNQDNEKPGS